MIDKTIKTIHAIASAPDRIEDITRRSNEFYFRFKGHVFSILKRNNPDHDCGNFTFYVYPDWTGATSALADFFDMQWPEELPMASFDSIGFDEEPFARLYDIVNSKYLGVDAIFDDILQN